MKIPLSAHEVLVFGLVWYALMDKRVPANEIQAAQNQYLALKQKNLEFLAERVENPVQFTYPDKI